MLSKFLEQHICAGRPHHCAPPPARGARLGGHSCAALHVGQAGQCCAERVAAAGVMPLLLLFVKILAVATAANVLSSSK